MLADLQRLEEIFTEALNKGTAWERAAYLDAACGADSEFRARVDRLLASHKAAGVFMQPPADDATTSLVSPHEGPGAAIGRYKLREQIGEGGFGVVYLAEQESPVRRLVALKVLKLGMDTRQVIARFEAERQALALMDHPNIARVLDGGATDSGRPYFVMELVRGIPITQYCNDHKLTAQERLELFTPVCRAIQHAHQKGIIHRDIKPSNVLVTTHDDRPVAKVIDFGIAKATQARLTDKTLYTGMNQLIGSPAYMSPEQAHIGGIDIDTRTDIYSLGVLLYELLAGTTPFDSHDLLRAAYGELYRVLREVDPAPPSVRIATLDHKTGVVIAAQRRCGLRHLRRLLRGDLDCIVPRHCRSSQPGDRARRGPRRRRHPFRRRHHQQRPGLPCQPGPPGGSPSPPRRRTGPRTGPACPGQRSTAPRAGPAPLRRSSQARSRPSL